ncbi:MAG: patatin-like phospholipase family protein [Patescibacteria group bacterium]
MNTQNKKTIGLALSGASVRSIFYIGFLEVLQEQNFQVDYIAATSSSAIVAAAYACGTLKQLKHEALNFKKKDMYSYFENTKAKTALYSFNRFEEKCNELTHGKKFEDVRPLMGFVSTDLESGERVVLSMGDIAKAVCATCAIPGMFEPVKWGARLLVDGGIITVIPGDVVKQAGCDTVVGIDLRTTPHVFEKWEIKLVKFFAGLKRLVLFNPLGKLYGFAKAKLGANSNIDYYQRVDISDNENGDSLGILGILSRAIDIADKAHKNDTHKKNNYFCDLLISPPIVSFPVWRRLLYQHFSDFSTAREMYLLGRRTALNNLNAMRKLIGTVDK